MRHLGSLLLSLLLAPVGWVLAGLGLVGYGSDLLSLALLVVAGVAYALLLLPRLAPTGPALAGAAHLVAAGWAVIAADSWRATVPDGFLGVDQVLTAPAEQLAALLGILLLLTVLQPNRWRRYDRVAALYAGPPGQGSHPPAYPIPPDGGRPPCD